MSSSTQGPWAITGRYGLNKVEIAGPDGNAVATVWAYKPARNDRPRGPDDYVEDPEGQANAALIAVAPELLEAAEQLLEVLDKDAAAYFEGQGLGPPQYRLAEAVGRARGGH